MFVGPNPLKKSWTKTKKKVGPAVPFSRGAAATSAARFRGHFGGLFVFGTNTFGPDLWTKNGPKKWNRRSPF